MISDSQMRYGSRVRRHSRSRCSRRNQSSSARRNSASSSAEIVSNPLGMASRTRLSHENRVKITILLTRSLFAEENNIRRAPEDRRNGRPGAAGQNDLENVGLGSEFIEK